MSRHHYVQSHEANSIDHDVKHLSAKELQDLYGIQFIEDPDSKTSTVWDPVANKEFVSLAEWAAHQVQEEQWSDLARANQNVRGYDEDYDF